MQISFWCSKVLMLYLSSFKRVINPNSAQPQNDVNCYRVEANASSRLFKIDEAEFSVCISKLLPVIHQLFHLLVKKSVIKGTSPLLWVKKLSKRMKIVIWHFGPHGL